MCVCVGVQLLWLSSEGWMDVCFPETHGEKWMESQSCECVCRASDDRSMSEGPSGGVLPMIADPSIIWHFFTLTLIHSHIEADIGCNNQELPFTERQTGPGVLLHSSVGKDLLVSFSRMDQPEELISRD